MSAITYSVLSVTCVRQCVIMYTLHQCTSVTGSTENGEGAGAADETG